MKKKLTKIWSVGLVAVLATSLLLFAAPVSAGTLSWSSETIPSATGKRIVDTADVTDFAVAGDGQTVWAVDDTNNKVYKSTNAGATWTDVTSAYTTAGGSDPKLIAIAPDNSDIVAIAETATVYVTTNGGTSWGSLGTPEESGGGAAATLLKDIDISADSAGTHYVGVAGQEGGGTNIANAWYFNVGAAAPVWKETNDKTGFSISTADSTAAALAFSPNFASDKVLVVVTEDDQATGDPDTIALELFSISTLLWNANAGFTSYPATIAAGTTYTDLAASISLSPDYLGSDDSLRIAFVGLDITGENGDDGIYRMSNVTAKALKVAVDIHSIAFDGTNLVAGEADSNIVYRSADPLATTPTVSSASQLVRPSGSQSTNVTNVNVAFAGADVLAGTRGDESAFSVSRDNGKSFNDISLVDSAAINLNDVALSADGSKIYLSMDDGDDFSLWRYDGAWERVLAIDGKTDVIVRLAPEDADVVYVADIGNGVKTMYYTQDGGDTKWFTRTSRYDIQDVAVESASVAYVAIEGGVTVSKSTNGGFTWGSAKSTKLTGGANIQTIKSLGEDQVIVGGVDGYVSYSTDGNSSWTNITSQVNASSESVHVTASGLATDDYIYAASEATGNNIRRWKIGTSTSWSDIISGTTTTASTDLPQSSAMGVYGLELHEGTLYALASDTTDSGLWRTLSPSTATSSSTWSYKLTLDATNIDFSTAAPNALLITSGSSKLWAIDTDNNKLYSLSDTLSEVGPTLTGPADGKAVSVNPVSGKSYDVSFTWDRLSTATEYDLQIAFDESFTEVAKTVNYASSSASVGYIVGPGGTTALEYMPETTYYWRVRVSSDGPLYSPYSEARSFTIGELVVAPPVVIQQIPPPVITIEPAPPPQITITSPDIILPPPPPPPPEIIIPAAPAPPAPITPAYIWAVIIIGAVLVIAVIVLILRTRRPI